MTTDEYAWNVQVVTTTVGSYRETRISPWTPALQARVLDLWKEGLSTSKIGESVGLTKNQVIGWLDRRQPRGRNLIPKHLRWPVELQDEITALLDAGASVWRIREVTGRNRHAITRWIEECYEPPVAHTAMDRLDAMHDKMDAALPVRRLPPREAD